MPNSLYFRVKKKGILRIPLPLTIRQATDASSKKLGAFLNAPATGYKLLTFGDQ